MNALVKVEIPSLALSEPELIAVLEQSVYPGAAQASIKLVIGYCRASHLDPLQKPVHIVPMDVKVKKQNGDGFDYIKRDVIMPGIGLYRTQAARTGEYAGITEPEFGPVQKMKATRKVWEGSGNNRSSRTVEEEIEYPEWCRMTVRRVVGGVVCDFTALEYWIENYATAGKDSTAPNAMWTKRKRGQIAKCAEAQALRKAFPEIGAQPTAEEMEGKTLEVGGDVIDNESGAVVTRPQVQGPKDKADTSADADLKGATVTGDEKKDDEGAPLSDGAKTALRKAMERAGSTDADLIAAGFKKVDELRFPKFNAAMQWIKENPANT